MHHLLKVFLDILRLRKGPQELPASELLLGIALALHLLLGTLILVIALPFGEAILGALVGTGLVVLLVQVALFLRGLPHRFVQTATALAGSEFLLALFSSPFTAWDHRGGGGAAALASAVALLVVGWSFAVSAHIFRHALNVSAWAGFGAALIYLVISYAVAGLVVGPGA